MKAILSLFIFLMFTMTAAAQPGAYMPSGKDRAKQVSGRYGNSDGICLFEDGSFLLYGYATAVFGHYEFAKDYLSFYPDKSGLFEAYACFNKNIGDSTRLNFKGFDRGGGTFIRLGDNALRPVFNEDANCFDAPFVYQVQGKLAAITLGNKTMNEDQQEHNLSNAWQYANGPGYNDFILVYNKPAREQQDFRGVFLKKPGTPLVIRLSNYGGDPGYRKQVQDVDEEKQWGEFSEMKNQYDQSKATAAAEGLFANEHYRLFSPRLADYIFDTATNQYVSRMAADNEGYFKSNPYQDDRYLHRYIKLSPQKLDSTAFPAPDIKTAPVFFTVCGEGSEKSYHYQGFEKYGSGAEDEGQAPVITEPASPME